MNQEAISAKKISKKWNSKATYELFSGLDLSLFVKEFLCLLGPSGCGKPTLLRILGGLDLDFSGKLVTSTHQAPAFVFQDHRLLPWLNTAENIYLPLKLRKQKLTDDLKQKIESLILRLGLKISDLIKFPHELSGGMKMRVAIARALIQDSKILFLDEPFSALDETTRYSLQELIRGLCEEEGLSILMVTHSINEAVYLSDRIQILGPLGQAQQNYRISFAEKRNSKIRFSTSFQNIVQNISEGVKKIEKD